MDFVQVCARGCRKPRTTWLSGMVSDCSEMDTGVKRVHLLYWEARPGILTKINTIKIDFLTENFIDYLNEMDHLF